MNMQITDSTTFTADILSHVADGIIHSVYRKTINILFKDQLLAIQCAGSPVSPLSMISNLPLDEFDSLNVEVGSPVIINKHKMIIKSTSGQSVSVDFSKCNIISTYLNSALSDDTLKNIRISIQNILCSGLCDGIARIGTPFPDVDVPLYLPVAEKDLADSLHSFQKQNWAESAHDLGRMIGLGIGLTPCGDDFLCGVLAALILRGKKDHPFTRELKAYILEHLKDTNDISSAFLACALQQHFSQAVHLLSQDISVNEIKNLFEQIGHSSGMDTLCGICYILELNF